MDLPSSIFLSIICPGHVYMDEQSHEKSTHKVKRKYKLAGEWPDSLKSQNVRMFFVSTSEPASTRSSTRVIITNQDYMACSKPQLLNKSSYYDLMKREILSGDEIKQKMTDCKNGFADVATVKPEIIVKFREKIRDLKIGGRPPITCQDIADIAQSVVDEVTSDKLLKELHIIH